MPIFAFQCLDCNKEFEEFTSFDKAGIYPGVSCPACESANKTRQISVPTRSEEQEPQTEKAPAGKRNYDFQCKDCNTVFEVFTQYDRDGNYPDVRCTKCDSVDKMLLISQINIGGPTKSKMANFEYRAHHNMEGAKDCRRKAEAATHMGADPYSSREFGRPPDDLAAGKEGVFHPFPMAAE